MSEIYIESFDLCLDTVEVANFTLTLCQLFVTLSTTDRLFGCSFTTGQCCHSTKTQTFKSAQEGVLPCSVNCTYMHFQ